MEMSRGVDRGACRTLVEAIDALLPQTQCGRCGFEACLPYAEAMADGHAKINRCPPGGVDTIANLAALLGSAPLPLASECGDPQPRSIAVVDEKRCVGCARCLPTCPVDAIVGARRQLHSILATACTGCERCVGACPVDCIRLVIEWSDSSPGTYSQALARRRADAGRAHCERRRRRLGRVERARRQMHGLDRVEAVGAVQAALARVRSPRARARENTPNP